MIKLMGVKKTVWNDYGKHEIIHNVSLQIETGELIAVMGPSGCGKSTLIGIMAGLDKPDCGSILYDGTELYDMPASELDRYRNKNIGVVFQNFNLIQELDCYDNICVPLVFSNEKVKMNHSFVSELIEATGLTELKNRYPTQMSGGEQQRAAIARALTMRPQLLLADEPTGALDSKNSRDIMQLFNECRKRFRLTVVVATHDMGIANNCDRILKMSDGRLG